ncbi:hypothetical protein MUK42_37355 [Musa troglodytarum]|uniref:Uncharacterized protein n=1 Tax=Musa troglodytarum TaxID=320322 RepID=A0A9E7GS19_9LILI|nr:hypothetical protein MUK42_37355 [Musa troglodytarum]
MRYRIPTVTFLYATPDESLFSQHLLDIVFLGSKFTKHKICWTGSLWSKALSPAKAQYETVQMQIDNRNLQSQRMVFLKNSDFSYSYCWMQGIGDIIALRCY